MALSSLIQLRSSVRDWAKRQSIGDSLIDDFVVLTESIMNYGERADDGSYLVYPLRTRDMETEAALAIGQGGLTGALPVDFLEMIRVRPTDGTQYSPQYISSEWLNDHSNDQLSDNPAFYAVTGGVLQYSVDMTITYYAKIPSLVADGQNWLLTKAPNAYLYGCLMQYSTWDKDAEKVAGYRALMNNALGGLNYADVNSRAGSMTRRASMPAF